jgi:hypothetical protein
MRATCSTHHFLLYLTALVVFAEEYRFWSSQLCCCVHSYYFLSSYSSEHFVLRHSQNIFLPYNKKYLLNVLRSSKLQTLHYSHYLSILIYVYGEHNIFIMKCDTVSGNLVDILKALRQVDNECWRQDHSYSNRNETDKQTTKIDVVEP